MKKLFKWKTLCIFSFFLIIAAQAEASEPFLSELHNEDYPQASADQKLIIYVDNVMKSEAQIHRAVLDIPYFRKLLNNDGMAIDLKFFRNGEVSAMHKILYFLYHNTADHENFFTPDDLADLIHLTLLFGLDQLGSKIAKKFKAKDDEDNLLDQLSRDQFIDLHHFLSITNRRQESWFLRLQKRFNAYGLNNQTDDRLLGLPFIFEPPVRGIKAVKEEEKEGNTFSEHHLNQGLKAQKIADEILALFHQESSEKNAKKRVLEFWYPAPKQLAALVCFILAKNLPGFDVSLPVRYTPLNEHSDMNKDWGCNETLGQCLASSLGWTCCHLMYFCQIFSGNYCACCGKSSKSLIKCSKAFCCSRDYWCANDLAVAVSNCAYDACSCNRRWIKIQRTDLQPMAVDEMVR